MMPIVIRDAALQDIDNLVRLLKQLFSIEKDFNFDAEKHRKGLMLMLEGCGKHRAVKVAVSGGAIVGMCTVQTRISTANGCLAAVLEDLVVNTDHRGLGIGKTLLAEIREWAVKRDIRHLQLLADKDNTPALDFYQHLKWQPTNLVCLTRKL